MNRVLEDIQPKNVFRFFEDICNIPHGSGNVEKISRYVLCKHYLLVLGGGGFAAAQCAAVLFAPGAEADLCPRDGAAVRLNGAGGGQPGSVLSDSSGEAHCCGGDRGRYVSWSLFRLYGGGAVRLFV